MRPWAVVLVSALVAAGWSVPASAGDQELRRRDPVKAAPGGPEYVPGEVLVKYRSGVSASERWAVRSRVGAALKEKVVRGIELVRTAPGESVQEAIAALERRPEVDYATPNHISRVSDTTPNDQFFADHQWPLRNTGQRNPQPDGQVGTVDADIDASEAPGTSDAWDRFRGSKEIVVAVIDTGVDYNHPDLKNNIWTNRGETGVDAGGKDKRSNNVDDDANGRVDDWRGWDFVSEDNNPKDDFSALPDSAGGHGTHVAGTIGASANNSIGVAGVNWQVAIMPVRVCDGTGPGFCTDADILGGVDYAAANGAHVANMSLGGSDPHPATEAAIAAAADTLFAVAAGNDTDDNDDPDTPTYPCNYPSTNIVCVAATENQDDYAGFSNWGAISVDLAAPGEWIASTYVDDNGNGYSDDYIYMAGTSMATPHVAGAGGFIRGMRPDLSPADVKTRILNNVDDITPPSNRTVTDGRLNLNDAISGLAAVLVTETGAGTAVTEEGSSDSYSVKLSKAPTANVTVTIDEPAEVDASAASLTFTPSNWNTPQTVTVQSNLADDTLYQGTRYGTIEHSASSTDLDFNVIGILDTVVAITDEADKPAPAIQSIPSNALGWLLKNAPSAGGLDFQIPFGKDSDTGVPGNWDGIVSPHGDSLGAVRSNSSGQWAWYLRNAISSGSPHLSFAYGSSAHGDRPVRGDWDGGSGGDGIGVVRPLSNGRWRWLLRDTASGGGANRTFDFGSRAAGDIPVFGDWDGDGGDDIGVVRPLSNGLLRWYLREDPSGGSPDRTFEYGAWQYGDRPVTGNWDGSTADGIGVTRKSSNGRWRWLLRQTANPGSANAGNFEFGSWKSKDAPVTGNWDGTGSDGIGVARP